MAYPAPSAKNAPAMGRKIRSGLKTVITFSRIIRNRAPSDTSLIFDFPSLAATVIGSK